MNKQEIIKETDIAIIGIGFRIPGDNNEPIKLYENLKSGFDAICEIPSERWSKNYSILGEINSNKAALLNFDDWKNFDPLIFGISPSEAANIDPQQRLSLISTWEALEDAYLDPIELRGSNTSVFMGSYAMDYLYGLKYNSSRDGTIGANFHCLANRISYCYDFKGQSVSVDTACSASSNAIISGIQTLITGNSNLSICGGTNFIIDSLFSKSLTASGMDTKSGSSKSFDASADGFARSEGCGIVVMKKLSDAINDGNKIYCIIKGFSSNADGNSNDKSNFLSPSINGQLSNIENAFKSTNGTVLPSDIFYVEAHGTGTPVGDPIELEAISKALKTTSSRSSDSQLFIGSLKSNIGHMEAASGVASLIKCCLLFKHRTLTPNIHFKNPNPKINFKDWNLKVVTDIISFPINKQISIMVNNFGASGSNTCFILSEYNGGIGDIIEGVKSIYNENQFLIPFSSNSKKSLDQYQSLINDNLVEKMEFNEFLIKQLFTKTTLLGQRSVICSKSDWSGFNDKNQKYFTTSNKSSNIVTSKDEPIKVFIFPGQGPQFNKMAIDLYNKELIFRESMNEINELFKKYFGHSVLDKLRSIKDDDNQTIHLPTIVYPSMMMFQISLFKLLKDHWNINPSFIIGHSLGEIPAAYCSGMIDLETCCKIIYTRSSLQDPLVGSGKMLAITIKKDEYNSNYLSKYPLIEIACFNSPNSIVVSGNEPDLISLTNELKSKSIQYIFLGTNVAYHSSILEQTKDDIISKLDNIKFNQPTIPIFSTLTGQLFSNDTQLFSPEYIFKSSREPVYFQKAIENLYHHIESNNIGNGSVVFVEISPHPVLSYYLNQLIPQDSSYFNKDSISILQTLNRKKNDIIEMNKTISQLYCQGCNVNFKNQLINFGIKNITAMNIHKQFSSSSFDLPRYQWDLQSYWLESEESFKNRIDGAPITILGNSNDLTSPFISRTTYIDVSKEPFQWLKGHMVKDDGSGVGGKNYFPGFGYIDIILNIYKNQDLLIECMEFKEPFILIDGKNLPLTTNITQTSPNQVKAEFHIKDQKSNKWIQNTTSNITIYKNNNNTIDKPNINFSIDNLKYQHNFTILTKSEFYKHIKRMTSINYSGCFQRVEQCWVGENNSTLIKVSTKQLISKNDNEMFLNGSILDCCVHGIFLTVEQSSVIVFDRIENFKFYSSNLPQSFKHDDDDTFIYVLSKTVKSNGYYIGTMVAFLEDGLILFESDRVICTSLDTSNIDSTQPEYPIDELYSFYLEPIDSTIPSVNSFEQLYQLKQDQLISKSSISSQNFKMILSNLLFKNISNRENKITIDSIANNSVYELMNIHLNQLNLNHSRLLQFVFETLKLSKLQNGFETVSLNNTISKTTEIISKLLFPLSNDDPLNDVPQSLFDDFNSKLIDSNNELFISNVISTSIKPQLNERMVFRILDFGCGSITLAENVLKEINQLLNENLNCKILIEYTFTDSSSSFLLESKDILSNLLNDENKNNISLLFKTFDFSNPSQDFKPSYFDFIIFSNVIQVLKNFDFSFDQIHTLLKSNGHLLFHQVPPLIVLNCIFSGFEKWWEFIDKHSSLLENDFWLKLLSNNGFINTLVADINGNGSNILIHTQKTELLSLSPITKSNSEFNIIIYTGGKQSEFIVKFINLISNQMFVKSVCSIVSSVEEFKNQNIPNNDKSLIFFISTIEPLDINNFVETTSDFNLIARHLSDNNKTNCKTSVISINSQCESTNYLNSSVLGVMKFYEDSPILIYSFDFDKESFSNDNTVLSTFNSLLLNSKQHIQIENIIRNNKVFFERIYKESINTTNNKNNVDEMYTKLNLLLENKIHIKPILMNDQIEIKVNATGINNKDYLNYQGLIPKELNYYNGNKKHQDFQSGYGYEFSGIVTKVGSDVSLYKVGDYVFGLSQQTTSSHLYVYENSNCIILKPDNINHLSAASIPLCYLTSFYSIFKIGNLDIEDDQSILIHDSSSDIGLSSLNLLKWKGYKSNIFVTVDSKEKEKYLYDNYGDFITGIYNSNSNYFDKIKLKLKQLGSDKNGVDLILNTINEIDYFDLNLKLLCFGGKIVDLSITHCNHNNFTNFKNFNNSIGYLTFDLSNFPIKKSKPILKEISDAISNGSLKLIETKKFKNFKDAIESFKKIQNGKIVVEMDNDLIAPLLSSSPYSLLPKTSKADTFGKTILITGQTGIILEILKWILSSSSIIENVIILSFSKLKWELKLLINQTIVSNNKIKFYFKSVDVGNEKLLNETIDEIYNENEQLPSVDSILHFAFENVIKKINEIDVNDFKQSHSAKTKGAINLHNISLIRNWNLKNFILSSSVASVLFHSGSPNYCSANNVLDAFSRYRKSIGLPCTTLNIGLITSTGVLSNNGKSTIDVINSIGILPIKVNLIFGVLDLILSEDNYHIHTGTIKQSTPINNSMICKMNINVSSEYLKSIRFSYKLDYYTNQVMDISSNKINNNELDGITEFLIKTISDLLSIESSLINLDFKLSDYGADSLHSTMLKNTIDKKFHSNIIIISQIQSMKIKSIIQTVLKSVNQSKLKVNEMILDNSNNSDNNLNYWENECKFEYELIKFKENTTAITTELESLNNQQKVLLTGVTGFVGIYLLYHLLQLDTCSIVYCTVRNKNNENESLQSIINNLKYHKLYENLNQNHLDKISILMISDLSDNNFGLSNELLYQTLSNSINLIIHCAANISLTANYQESKQTNIGSLKQLIKFAFNKKIKRFVNFSTMAIFVNDNFNNNDFDESNWPSLSNMKNKIGYIQSKIISEILLKQAFTHGLPSILIRLPIIFSNSNTGIGSKNDFFQLLLQSCFIEKCYFNSSSNDNNYYIPTPIDWVSKCIMKLIFNNSDNFKTGNETTTITVYNLHNDSITLSSIFEMISSILSNDHQQSFKVLDYETWDSIIKNSKNDICKRFLTFKPSNLQFLNHNIKLSQKTKYILLNNNINIDDIY